MIFMNSLFDKLCMLLSLIGSYVVAIIRHLFLTFIFLVSGIQQILFTRVEIVNIEMKALPLRCDRRDTIEKLSYIDKLCCENPELLTYPEDEDDDGLDFPREDS